ncbi:hypothetical protein N7470_007554 [Penicillium chermesinum]|nr:hypothetical protein N7470_007554 [Penicillium chermesinum]
MDVAQAYILSPGSLLVGVVSVALLINGAWPRLYRRKQLEGFTHAPIATNNESLAVSKEPEVPPGWWKSREVFELEHRAIFSKSWLYLAHSAQFAKPGAYQSFDIAGYPVFLIRGKDNQIRGFHNVCRHRAYTITRKETGASTVLGCRYHGWSYDTYGRLVKAPQFEDIEGFEKSENGLFEVHTHTTVQGHVFVNLDANQPGPFDESTRMALDKFCLAAGLKDKSNWVSGHTLAGEFNWKFGSTSQNLKNVASQLEERITQLRAPSVTERLIDVVAPKNNQANCSLFPISFFYSFEKADLWISLTFLPSSETSTALRFDIFTSSKARVEESWVNSVQDQVQAMIKEVESNYRLASASDRPVENTLATHRIVKQLQEHQKLEKTAGGPISPAMRQPKGSSLFEQAEQLCKEIDCSGPGSDGNGASGGLDW